MILFLCPLMMLLFYIFSVCIVVQTLFAVWMLWASGGTKQRSEVSNVEPLSIIICAHNEAEQLKKNLPTVLQQSHPHFEVIVVNDASDDESAEILEGFSMQYPNLAVITIISGQDRTLPGKKFALSLGLAAAKNEHLLLCDADCIPASDQWASIMSAALQSPKQIVAGYGAYHWRPGLLNTFVRWETMHTFLQYSSYTKVGLPYMAVGRNLACTKSVLLAAQTNPIWSSMPSGDDDLLIRLEGKKDNVVVIAEPDSFTYSEAKSTFKEWLKQKQRHLSTGKLYKKHIQFLLSLYGFSHGLMWLLALLIWIGGLGYLISSMFLLRCMLVWCLWAITADNLKEKRLILYLPLCDIAWAFYNLILSPYIFYKTKKQWT